MGIWAPPAPIRSEKMKGKKKKKEKERGKGKRKRSRQLTKNSQNVFKIHFNEEDRSRV